MPLKPDITDGISSADEIKENAEKINECRSESLYGLIIKLRMDRY